MAKKPLYPHVPKSQRKYLAPVCPHCSKPLRVVGETTYETYIFDDKTGDYNEEERKSELKVECQNCGANISELFPEGACNYQAEREGG